MRGPTAHVGIMTLGALFLMGSVSEAQPWGKGRKGGGHGRCMRLMKAHPDVLKAKLGLNDAQIKKIQDIGYNKASKAI